MSQVRESLSLEETNKIRVSLGLKPLPTDQEDTSTDPDTQAQQNYKVHLQQQTQQNESQATRLRILKAKENRERLSKLKGRGLADLEPGQSKDEDLKKWVKKHKSKKFNLEHTRLAARLKEESLNREEELLSNSYGSKDLAGLRVAHDLVDIQSNLIDNQEAGMVLTLKDSRILEAEDDQLENQELSEQTKNKEALELKKQGKRAGQYTGYDDDQFLDPGQSKTVLAKYSDTIDGKREKSFTLGGELVAGLDDRSERLNENGGGELGSRNSKRETAEMLKKDLLSLDYSKVFANDYLQEDDPNFKKKLKKDKQKKKKQHASSRKAPSDMILDPATIDQSLVASSAMDIDDQKPPLSMVEDSNVIDDEEVQAAMSRMRREVGKLRRKTQQQQQQQNFDVEMASIKSEADPAIKVESNEDLVKVEEGEESEDDGRLIVDDTSEFIRTISLQQQRVAELRKKEEAENRLKVERQRSLSVIPEDGDGGVESPIDEEEERKEMERLMAGFKSEQRSAKGPEVPAVGGKMDEKKGENEDSYIATGSEKYVLNGMASTLSLLKSQGLIKPLTPEEREKERLYKEKTKWLIEQRRRDAIREAEKERTKRMGDAKDQATREYENRVRESMMARETMEAYRHYKPDVEIKYNDEFGRELTQKEAWKALSHKFHGKGSGKAKTEKRIKKIEEGKKLDAMASGDTPTGTNEAFRKRQEKLGSATMVLSVGNKGSAPHQEEFLSSLSKSSSSTSTTKKSKQQNSSKEMIGSNTISHQPNSNGHSSNRNNSYKHRNERLRESGNGLGEEDLMNGLGSQINSGILSMMAPRKAGFKPISDNKNSASSKTTVGGSNGDGRVISSKAKISIGLGSGKRKADELDSESLEGHESKRAS
ncbi:SART-1 family-domain-containing protein [Phakopsora pachyrhizi]|uniref:SART-1 family-domain-containing protein n=1 Tax=Phakopsora pachyrhizi TaxID=170000 RepID=A0AAV0AFL2_PHAPC|nr:SART-1 family-domain-containing protein [Phakopsora pachyrhizi]